MREGWTYKKLGEVGDIVTGSTPSTKDSANYSSNDYCFVKPSDLPSDGIGRISSSEYYLSNKGYSISRQLPKGTVLVSCIGSIGKVGILEVEAAANQQINAIVPHDNIDPEFLSYSIYSIRESMMLKANAPVVPIINKTDFSNYVIPVPPLPEQERIVSELDFLSSIIEKKKEQLKEYDQLAQSIFYDMFGDPIENEKGWDVKKLGEVYELKSGDNLSAKHFVDGQYPVYGGNGISGFHNSFNMDGNYIIIGRVGAYCGNVRNVIGKFWLTDNAFQLIYDIKRQNPIFVKFVLTYLDLHQYANHAAQPVISNISLKEIKVPYPPLSLQQFFTEKIEAIERQKELIKQSIAETETLFNSRMDYYFN